MGWASNIQFSFTYVLHIFFSQRCLILDLHVFITLCQTGLIYYLFFIMSKCMHRNAFTLKFVGSPNTSTFERQMAPRGNAQMWSPWPYNLCYRRLFPFISLFPSFIVLTHATTTLQTRVRENKKILRRKKKFFIDFYFYFD